MSLRDPRCGRDGEGRDPEARRETRLANVARERGEAAWDARARFQPVTVGDLIAVVDDHAVDGRAARPQRRDALVHPVLVEARVGTRVPGGPRDAALARDAGGVRVTDALGPVVEQSLGARAGCDFHALHLDPSAGGERGPVAPLRDRESIGVRVEGEGGEEATTAQRAGDQREPAALRSNRQDALTGGATTGERRLRMGVVGHPVEPARQQPSRHAQLECRVASLGVDPPRR